VSRRGLLLVALAVVCALAGGPGRADAFYGNGAAIVSASFQKLEEGDDATFAGAISADGRFVVFQTLARNFYDDADPGGYSAAFGYTDPGFRVGGVFRRDMATGAVEMVADGDFHKSSDPVHVAVLGAGSPSISGDGRYVAFSTAERLVPQDVNDNIDVYVRDMTVPVRQPGAYTLVSARSGSNAPPAYAAGSSPSGNPGADVWKGVAISRDGRRVVFRTEADSDLSSAPGDISTPAHEVYLRDLDTGQLSLVTQDQRPGSTYGDPVGGATGPAGISGDGSTVAWTGGSADVQVPIVNGENVDSDTPYYLWRRVADGPNSPTRRITGFADPDDPACDGGSVTFVQTQTGPCFGPLTQQESLRNNIQRQPPSLSDDGTKVVFLTGTGPRPNDQTGPSLDAWITDMSPGISRKAGSRELTRDSVLSSDVAANGQVSTAVLSGDGRHVAIATNRTQFLVPGLASIGTFRRLPDHSDIYVIDLNNNTIERGSRGFNGADSNGDATPGSLSVTPDGGKVAFASDASNLFFGDANGTADMFVISRQAEPAQTGPPEEKAFEEPPLPDLTPPELPPELAVRAKSLPKGVVQLIVTVPEPGEVDAVEKAAAKSPAKKKRKKGKNAATAQKTVANATVKDANPPTATVTLKPASRYAALVRKQKKIAADVTVAFRPASVSSQPLSATVHVNLAWAPKSAKKTKKPKRKKKGA
jgi:Tol biopolymer transport system component